LYGYGNAWKDKAIIKPDIVFFGSVPSSLRFDFEWTYRSLAFPSRYRENLSDEFDRKLLADRDEVDLLIVMGTSLRVSLGHSHLITSRIAPSSESSPSTLSRRYRLSRNYHHISLIRFPKSSSTEIPSRTTISISVFSETEIPSSNTFVKGYKKLI
jgi:hypothetical protein